MTSQERHPRSYSFEFFPPADEAGVERLRAARRALAVLRPDFFSVTYGAGGSTRNRTIEAVTEIHLEGAVEAAPHLTCVGATRESVTAMLGHYRDLGIGRIVALRGDLPGGLKVAGELRHADELVAHIRDATGSHFQIEVAAYPEFHPQAPSARHDFDHFKRKVDAGADSALTQYFYNADAYFAFIEACERAGIDLPIVPGIMPITNFKQLARFSDGCGAEIPRWIRQQLEAFGDDKEGLRAFGEEVVTRLCDRLLEGGAPGLHFYTMNRAKPAMAIWRNLGLPG